MLASEIHDQHNSLFCASTTVQLSYCDNIMSQEAVGSNWRQLYLTDSEKDAVDSFESTGCWGDVLFQDDLRTVIRDGAS